MAGLSNNRAALFIALSLLLLALFAAIDSYSAEHRQAALTAGLPKEAPDEYTFLVVGDTHGHGEFFATAAEREKGALFTVHLGDFTASGTEKQYDAFLEQCGNLGMPVIAVPGNHDVKNNGARLFDKLCGPANRSFTLGGIKYVFCDTSGMFVSDSTLHWLAGELDVRGKKILFTHVPPRDPLGRDHSLLNDHNAGRFLELLEGHEVAALFTGHVHCYFTGAMGNTKTFISGGGGGPLYADQAEGGFHHYLRVRVTGDEMQVEAVPLEVQPVSGELLVRGEHNILLTLEDLQVMAATEGSFGFENKFGNVSGRGQYRGVRVDELVEQAGGMGREDVLVIHSQDGFIQECSYQNVYPSGDVLKKQGLMVLAYRFDGKTVPAWTEGYRIVFMPGDGLYSNDDCAATSAPGQGWHQYPSAGARWARNVDRIEVLPCRNN